MVEQIFYTAVTTPLSNGVQFQGRFNILITYNLLTAFSDRRFYFLSKTHFI